MIQETIKAGADVVVKRVPETVPEDLARKSGFKLDQAAPIATVDELTDYDAIIIGTPTRFGNMTAQMKNFLDQTGGLWAQGKLIGRSARCSPRRRRSTGARRARSCRRTSCSWHGDCRPPVFVCRSDGCQ